LDAARGVTVAIDAKKRTPEQGMGAPCSGTGRRPRWT
jgi:hypothetical protein